MISWEENTSKKKKPKGRPGNETLSVWVTDAGDDQEKNAAGEGPTACPFLCPSAPHVISQT